MAVSWVRKNTNKKYKKFRAIYVNCFVLPIDYDRFIIGFLFVNLGASVIFASPISESKPKLLGAKECTYGPTYWCSNIT